MSTVILHWWILQAYQRKEDEDNRVVRPSFSPFSVQKKAVSYLQGTAPMYVCLTLIPIQADDVSSF